VKHVVGNGHFAAFNGVRLLRDPGASAGAVGTVDAGSAVEVEVFGMSSGAPAEARHFAVGAAQRLGAGHLADDVALIVTELAANAKLHARSGFTVMLSARLDAVRISVRDESGLRRGELLPVAPMHGLGVVTTLASEWGVVSLGDAGKAVWAELKSVR
jgi:hypothetical protein